MTVVKWPLPSGMQLQILGHCYKKYWGSDRDLENIIPWMVCDSCLHKELPIPIYSSMQCQDIHYRKTILLYYYSRYTVSPLEVPQVVWTPLDVTPKAWGATYYSSATTCSKKAETRTFYTPFHIRLRTCTILNGSLWAWCSMYRSHRRHYYCVHPSSCVQNVCHGCVGVLFTYLALSHSVG